jgi:hypothetical protein
MDVAALERGGKGGGHHVPFQSSISDIQLLDVRLDDNHHLTLAY